MDQLKTGQVLQNQERRVDKVAVDGFKGGHNKNRNVAENVIIQFIVLLKKVDRVRYNKLFTHRS